jgi:hypothetical protein
MKFVAESGEGQFSQVYITYLLLLHMLVKALLFLMHWQRTRVAAKTCMQLQKAASSTISSAVIIYL